MQGFENPCFLFYSATVLKSCLHGLKNNNFLEKKKKEERCVYFTTGEVDLLIWKICKNPAFVSAVVSTVVSNDKNQYCLEGPVLVSYV